MNEFVNRTVSVITQDGRFFVGTLRGHDHLTNLILDKSHERVFSAQGVEKVDLGLYIIRGDNVALVGEINEHLDESISLDKVSAQPLNPVIY
eukprot:m.297810 g.297810  ORF g.297810 m.297810 type:complete len:92 (+) comp13705_c0_seq1:3-278(+)